MMNICGICAYYRKGGYCFKKHRDIGYMMTQPCFESKPIQENIVEPIKSNRMETKVCKHCGKELPIDQFATFRGKPTCICKECKRKSAIEGGRNRHHKPTEKKEDPVPSAALISDPAPDVKEWQDNLSWDDVRTLVRIMDGLLESMAKKDILVMGEKGLYTMVLSLWRNERRNCVSA